MTPEDRVALRVYVPEALLSDADADARWLVLGSWQAVAFEFVLRFRNERLLAPTSITIPGEYAETWGSIDGLNRLVSELGGLTDEGDAIGGGSITVATMERSDRWPGRR